MRIPNKKARFNYELGEKVEAGIALAGSEAKALRETGADLSNSYVKILNNEAYLINANIPIRGKLDYNPTRMRRLLLHRSEILSLATKMKQQRLTLVPVSLYNTHNLWKLEIALGKPKRKFEKKKTIQKKDLERDLARELSDRG